jgi:hypothetical protein
MKRRKFAIELRHHILKCISEMEVKFLTFLTTVLNGDKFAFCSSCFITREGAPSTHWTEDWKDLKPLPGTES